jgi:transcription antitermination protein NusB
MAVPQQKIREIVFQLLYGHDWPATQNEELHSLLSKELKVSKKVVLEAQQRVNVILKHVEELDQIIAKTSEAYAFERIPSTERNILRLGTFELLFDSNVPSKVAIAESIRLARKFSTPESATFVNAIMDSLYKNSLHDQDTGSLEQASGDD